MGHIIVPTDNSEEHPLLKSKDGSQSTNYLSPCEKHILGSIQIMKQAAVIPDIPLHILQAKTRYLPKPIGYENKKTIIFDIDETLVHCTRVGPQSQNIITVPLDNDNSIQVNINIRPYAIECLRAASKMFEVIAFTASEQNYADAVLQLLDPSGTLIHHRLYKSDCIDYKGCKIKDLRIISGRRLEDMLIVDNSMLSFCKQLNNGVPIVTWMEDPLDCELLSLMDYMYIVTQVDDVRILNRELFCLERYFQETNNQFY